MGQPYIRLGDRTSHGGTVIEADMTTDIHGIPVAMVGHNTVCPRCRGVFPIVTGADDVLSMGRPWARHGDKTACGASLLCSQVTSFWVSSGGTDSPANEQAPATKAGAPSSVAPQTPTLCLECLVQAAQRGSSVVVRA